MKIIINGETIPQNSEYIKLFRVMANPTTRIVINEIRNSFQAVSYISNKSGHSQSTVYRILKILKMFNIVTIKISINKKGSKKLWYKSQFNSIIIN